VGPLDVTERVSFSEPMSESWVIMSGRRVRRGDDGIRTCGGGGGGGSGFHIVYLVSCSISPPPLLPCTHARISLVLLTRLDSLHSTIIIVTPTLPSLPVEHFVEFLLCLLASELFIRFSLGEREAIGRILELSVLLWLCPWSPPSSWGCRWRGVRWITWFLCLLAQRTRTFPFADAIPSTSGL
jgi:hypothetical protein